MPTTCDREGARRTADHRRRFVATFNQLVESMKSFAETYNAGQIDVKKVKALKKAWRELESSEPWFKPDKTK